MHKCEWVTVQATKTDKPAYALQAACEGIVSTLVPDVQHDKDSTNHRQCNGFHHRGEVVASVIPGIALYIATRARRDVNAEISRQVQNMCK